MAVYKDNHGNWNIEIEREVSISANHGDAEYEKSVTINFSEDELRDMIDAIQEAQANEVKK